MIWLLPWEEEGDARHMPWATWTLLLVNMVVFLMMWAGNDADRRATIDAYGLVSGDWHWYQFITANFLHGGWMHVLGNMFFLWILADLRRYGRNPKEVERLRNRVIEAGDGVRGAKMLSRGSYILGVVLEIPSLWNSLEACKCELEQ